MTRANLVYETVPSDFSSYWSLASLTGEKASAGFLLLPLHYSSRFPQSLQVPPVQVAACLCVSTPCRPSGQCSGLCWISTFPKQSHQGQGKCYIQPPGNGVHSFLPATLSQSNRGLQVSCPNVYWHFTSAFPVHCKGRTSKIFNLLNVLFWLYYPLPPSAPPLF